MYNVFVLHNCQLKDQGEALLKMQSEILQLAMFAVTEK